MIFYVALLIFLAIKLTRLMFFFLLNMYWISTECMLLYKVSYIHIITIRLANAKNVISLALAAEKPYESPDFIGSQPREGFTPGMAVAGDLSALLL